MEKIIENLEKIVNEQLEECIKNKTVPSKEVLDTINTLILFEKCI